MVSTDRRTFLSTAARALTGAALLSPVGRAWSLPGRSHHPVSAFFPDLVEPTALRALAATAIDTARQAGATYADVRVSTVRTLGLFWPVANSPIPNCSLNLQYAYGLRVCVDGAWQFAFGVDPTKDGIARTARSAVSTAASVARLTTSRFEMVPAPVVHGEWTTQCDIDPFSISPDAHVTMLGAYIDAMQRIPDGGFYLLSNLWTDETRVFASTEGSLITQRFVRSDPRIAVHVKRPLKTEGVTLPVLGLVSGSWGVEHYTGSAVQDRIKATTEEAARLAGYPETPVDIGRYDAVLDGTALGGMCGATLAQALELDRALGNDADGAGTSILAPVDTMLGEAICAPVINVVADRATPHYGAAQWDDEGVATETFPLITQGRLVDYFSTRTSACALATWYAKQNKPVASHGSAVSWAPTTSPEGCASQLTIILGPTGTTFDTLMSGLTDGILVRGVGTMQSDQQLAGGIARPTMLYEVKRGRITRRLLGGMVQFRTLMFWRSPLALGDASTVQSYSYTAPRGELWTRAVQPIVAPAAHCRDVEIIRVGRQS